MRGWSKRISSRILNLNLGMRDAAYEIILRHCAYAFGFESIFSGALLRCATLCDGRQTGVRTKKAFRGRIPNGVLGMSQNRRNILFL